MTKEQPFLESGRIRNEVNIQKSDKVNNCVLIEEPSIGNISESTCTIIRYGRPIGLYVNTRSCLKLSTYYYSLLE